MAYSVELKQKALDYLDKCGKINQVAIAFGVDRGTIRAWVKKKQSGNLSHCSGGYRYSKIDKEQLLNFIQAKPDAYLYEIAQLFDCSRVAVFKALKRINITLNKSTTYIEQDPQKVKEYQDGLNKLQRIQNYELVYIDETGIDTYLHRPYARSLKGQKAYDKTSGKRYQRLSLVAGQIGNQAKNLIAPFIYQNTMTSNLFERWFEQMLQPGLDKTAIIILGNIRFHRMKHLQALANGTKYRHIILPLALYSPELNPIERTWATIKKWLRSYLSKFETIEQGVEGYLGVS